MTRDLDHELVEANPVPQRIVDAHPLNGADTALVDAILAVPTVPALDRRPLRRVGRGAVVAVAALALTAAGLAVRARTGVFGGGAGHEEGTGEVIRLDAPDAGAVVDRIGMRIALPPGGSFDHWKQETRGRSDGAVTMTESGISTSLSLDAACQWTRYWLDAYRAGDAPAMAGAEPVLRAIPDWSAIAAGDPSGDVRVLLRRRAAGAAAHDPAQFLAEFTNNCPSFAPPG